MVESLPTETRNNRKGEGRRPALLNYLSCAREGPSVPRHSIGENISPSRISENSVKPRPNKAPTFLVIRPGILAALITAVNDATIINHCIEFL